MNLFDEEEKIYVNLQIRGHGKTNTFDGVYEDCVSWQEILDDVVKTLEASWGYSFDLDIERPEYGSIGIYFKSKDSEDNDDA